MGLETLLELKLGDRIAIGVHSYLDWGGNSVGPLRRMSPKTTTGLGDEMGGPWIGQETSPGSLLRPRHYVPH